MHGLDMHLIRVFRYIQAAHLHLNLHDCELINNRFSLMAFGDLPYIVVLIGRTRIFGCSRNNIKCVLLGFGWFSYFSRKKQLCFGWLYPIYIYCMLVCTV